MRISDWSSDVCSSDLGRFKDFISTPKPNGYRSLHTTIIGPERHRIEVQIRTNDMHEVAEYGVAAHWIYKQDSPQVEGRQYRWMRELLDILEHADNPEEFLEHTKLEMFQRSEERRVGKECVSTGSSRWSADH